jgi:hypothetical protein
MIIEMAIERIDGGRFQFSLREIGERFGISASAVRKVCRKAGMSRTLGIGPSIIPDASEWYCPASLKNMLEMLTKKVGSTEAHRMIREHAGLRRITQ